MVNKWLLSVMLIGWFLFALPLPLFLDCWLIAILFGLTPSEDAHYFSTVLPMAVLLNVHLLFCFWLIWWLVPGQRLFDPAWRGVVRNTPRGPRVRLQPMGRMFVVWAVLLITSFFAIMVAGLILDRGPTNRPPEIETQARALIATALIWFLGGCFATAVGRWEPFGRVVQDDANADTLSWWNHGRRYERAVVRHLVTQVSVRNGRSLTGMSDPTSRRVVLHWTNAEGEGMADTIAEYQNHADAEALARWLRERLGLAEEPPCSPEGATGNSQG